MYALYPPSLLQHYLLWRLANRNETEGSGMSRDVIFQRGKGETLVGV